MLNDWTSFHTLSSWMVFHQYEFFYVSSNCMNAWTSFHTLSSWMVLHQYEYFHVSSNAVIDWTFHKIFFVVHGGSTTEFVPELKKRYFKCVMKIFSCICVHAAEKVWNVKNNAVIKCVIRALSICTSKNLVFPDFLIRLNRKSGFFFHQNMTSCIRLNLRP